MLVVKGKFVKTSTSHNIMKMIVDDTLDYNTPFGDNGINDNNNNDDEKYNYGNNKNNDSITLMIIKMMIMLRIIML